MNKKKFRGTEISVTGSTSLPPPPSSWVKKNGQNGENSIKSFTPPKRFVLAVRNTVYISIYPSIHKKLIKTILEERPVVTRHFSSIDVISDLVVLQYWQWVGWGMEGLVSRLHWSGAPVQADRRSPVWSENLRQRTKVLFYRKFSQKKMINLDEEKIECALGNREFWLGKKAENGVFLFLTSELAVFICLWLQPNSTRSIMFCNISFSQNHSMCTFLY